MTASTTQRRLPPLLEGTLAFGAGLAMFTLVAIALGVAHPPRRPRDRLCGSADRRELLRARNQARP